MYKALWHLFRFKSCHIFECKHNNYFVNTYLDLYIKMRIKSSSSSECDKYAYNIYNTTDNVKFDNIHVSSNIKHLPPKRQL